MKKGTRVRVVDTENHSTWAIEYLLGETGTFLLVSGSRRKAGKPEFKVQLDYEEVPLYFCEDELEAIQ